MALDIVGPRPVSNLQMKQIYSRLVWFDAVSEILFSLKLLLIGYEAVCQLRNTA